MVISLEVMINQLYYLYVEKLIYWCIMNFKYKCVNVFKEFVLILRGGYWEVSFDYKKEIVDLERGYWKVS